MSDTDGQIEDRHGLGWQTHKAKPHRTTSGDSVLALTVPTHAVDQLINARMNGCRDVVRVSAQFGCRADMVNREAQQYAEHQRNPSDNRALSATVCSVVPHLEVTSAHSVLFHRELFGARWLDVDQSDKGNRKVGECTQHNTMLEAISWWSVLNIGWMTKLPSQKAIVRLELLATARPHPKIL